MSLKIIDDPFVIIRDRRGSYKRIPFYDDFQELELEAKEFAIDQAIQKQSSFLHAIES